MALVVGVNSWVTLAEAETYFSERIGSEPWDTLSDDPTKEKYLISAYKWLVRHPAITMPPSTSAPQGVKDGQCEAALFLIEFYDEYRKREGLFNSGVERFKKSKWQEWLKEATLPNSVTDPIEDEGYFNGGPAGMECITDNDPNY